MRTIKSFVLRAGRISKRQQLGLNQGLKSYELCFEEKSWDLEQIFQRKADTIVEIGFGMGATLLTMAKQQPQDNFIGIEVHRAGIGSLVADAEDAGIKNLRIIPQDAVIAFNDYFLENSLAAVHIFFPDPWPKKKHHKRRLIQPNFIKLILRCLKPGGIIHCATDWQEYAEQMLEVLENEKGLKNSQTQGGFAPRPATRPLTKFELRGNRLGHGVWDLIYIKK